MISARQGIGLVILSMLGLAGCDEAQQSVPTFEVQKQTFSIELSGFGEVEAAKAQKIISPGRQPMAIAWLAEENTLVKKGDVIARFDAEQLMKDSRKQELEMLSLQQDIEQSQAQKNQQHNEVKSEQNFVVDEYEFADRFAIDDLRVYSKLEIIDSFQNRDFLGAKEQFLSWKQGSIEQQNNSNIEVLAIQQRGHQAKYQNHQDALSKLNVYAPNDGLLTYEKDRRGEKPSVGQTVFPGRPIATIPDLSRMQAKVFVLAKDAIGLAPGNQVKITLDAFPQRQFDGKVSSVSGFPRSIERGNPVTYYELVVALEQQDPELLQPGRKLKAQILVDQFEQRVVVPLQAIHHKQGRSFVYKMQGFDFVEQPVQTAQKNLYFVEITDGIEAGDRIALSVPEDHS